MAADKQSTLAKIADNAKHLWLSGYNPVMRNPEQFPGQYEVLKPGQRDWYRVNLLTGTCQLMRRGVMGNIEASQCPSEKKYQTCKHCQAVAALVLRGEGDGLPAEDVAALYEPSLLPGDDLSPDLDTTSTDEAVAELAEEAIARWRQATEAFIPTEWAKEVKPTDVYQPCPICSCPVPKGMTCFRHGVTESVPVTTLPKPKVVDNWY